MYPYLQTYPKNLEYRANIFLVTRPLVAKKSEVISAIMSFANAKATNDANLLQFSANFLNSVLDTLEYEPETSENKVAED